MKFSKTLILTISIIALTLALIIPYLHDYGAYIRQWNYIYEGKDPYIGTGNAYGVFYNFFAYIGLFKYFALPRFTFVFIYLLASYLIWKKSLELKINHWVLILLFFNPLFWIFSVKYGSNDSFLAGITLIGVYLYVKKEYLYSGILFSIAISFKFIPLFLVPFFIFNNRKINFKYLIPLSIGVLFFFGVGYLLWGNSILEPLLFGSKRPSSLFSIFRFIRGKIQPLGFLGIKNLDFLSTGTIVTSFIITFYYYLKYNLDKYLMSLLALSFIIVFYKVGHHQFYISFLLLSSFVLILNYKFIKNDKKIFYSYFFFLIWIFSFTLLYDYTFSYSNSNYKFGRLIHIVGLPTFILHNLFNYFLIKLIIRKHEYRKCSDNRTKLAK